MSSPKRSLPKEARLRKSIEFKRTHDKGIRLISKHFTVLVSKRHSPRVKTSRLGVTVSTKIDKRAVVRNRVKRYIRETFRNHKHSLSECFDIVVIARQNAGNCSLLDVRREILGTLKSKGFLRPAS